MGTGTWVWTNFGWTGSTMWAGITGLIGVVGLLVFLFWVGLRECFKKFSALFRKRDCPIFRIFRYLIVFCLLLIHLYIIFKFF